MKKIILYSIVFSLFYFTSICTTSVHADTISLPRTINATTMLNPIYLPLITQHWQWYLGSSWDKTGGNMDGGQTGLIKEGNSWILLNNNNGPGLITRIWIAPPVSDLPAMTILIYTDNNPSPIVLNLNDFVQGNIPPNTFPLLADVRSSSGGFVSYKPIAFSSKVKIVTSAIDPGYFQINYTLTPTQITNDSHTIEQLAQHWNNTSMGKSADIISNTGISYNGIAEHQTPITIPGSSESQVFSKNGAGTITKIAFSADQIKNSLSSLRLKIHYGDQPNIGADIPLNMLFVSPSANFISNLPPTQGLDAYTISPTGKEIVIKGNTTWIREPFLEHYNNLGTNISWWRESLEKLFAGPGSLPPTDNIDVYSIDSNGGEHVIKGGQYWSRSNSQVGWYTNTLASAWPGNSSNGFPLPHTNIEAHTFNDTGGETIISSNRYWFRANTSSPWWSDTIQNAWNLDLNHIDGHTFSPQGETIISGDKYWNRPNPQANWSSNTLNAVWQNNKFYSGSLFFGFDQTKNEYYITWPIPFQNGITVSLTNTASIPLSPTTTITESTDTYNPQFIGYFSTHLSTSEESTQNQLHTVVDIAGTGKFVGLVLKAKGDLDIWGRTFLEGDDIIVVDGEVRGQGTGTEDLFNSGWYFIHGPMYLPTHGSIISIPNRLQSPIGNDPNKLGIINTDITLGDSTTLMYRHFLNDAIIFTNNFKMNLEFGPSPLERKNKGKSTYFESLSIAYISPNSLPSTPLPGLPAQAGDLNSDGQVNIYDYNLLVSKFGNPYTIFDYNDLVTNFGR